MIVVPLHPILDHPEEQKSQSTATNYVMNDFHDFAVYYLGMLKVFPILDKINDERIQNIFTQLRDKLIELQSKSQISDNNIANSKTLVFTLFAQVRSLLSTLCIEEKVIKHCQEQLMLQSQENDPQKTQSFDEKKKIMLDNCIANMQVQPKDELFMSSLTAISTTCGLIGGLGDKIESSLTFNDDIHKVNTVISDVIDFLKITTDVKSEMVIYQRMDQLKKSLCELENDYSRMMNQLRQDRKNEILFKGLIELNSQKIGLLTEEAGEWVKQIKKLEEEIKTIKEAKGDIMKKFEKQRNETRKNYDEQLKKTLELRKAHYEKFNKEQEKVLGDLEAIKTVQEKKVNYVVIIDRSGSMGGQIQKVNEAAEKFLLNLPKNDNFFFTVIYFQSKAVVKANTVPLSSTTDFKQFLNLTASGGTDYSSAFEILYPIILENRRNGIDRINAIFFTDGADGGDFQNAYKNLTNIKSTFGNQITLYIRGLGKFEPNDKQHLDRISMLINSGSETHVKIRDVDFVNDVDEITNFFINISKGVTEYYAAIKEKLKALESLKDSMHEEDMRIRQKNSHIVEYEIARIDSMEKTDFKKVEEREKLAVAFNLQLDAAKASMSKAKSEIQDLSNKIKEYETEIEILAENNIKKAIDALKEQKENKLKEIEQEKIVIEEQLKEKALANHEISMKKSSELGFPKVDDYYLFQKYAEEFAFSFQKLEELSKRVGCKIKNYPVQMSLQARKVETQINSETTAQISEIFTSKSYEMLQAQNQPLDIKPDTYGKTIASYINLSDKQYVFLICDKFKSDIISILNKPEKSREASMEALIEKAVKLFGDRGELEASLGELEKSIANPIDDDGTFKILNEDLEALQKEMEDEEDDSEKRKLKEQKTAKTKEISDYRKNYSLSQRKLVEEKKLIEKDIKSFDKDMMDKQKKAFLALSEIIRVCDHWVETAGRGFKIKNIKLPVEYFLNEIAFEKLPRKSIK